MACSVIPSPAARVATLVVLALCASTRSTEAMCVDVSLQFRGGKPPPTLVESMKEEADWIWGTYGVHIGWPTANGTRGCAQPQVSLDVLVDLRRSWRPKFVLGSTRLTPSPIRHASIHIDYEAIEQLLQSLNAGHISQQPGRLNTAPVDLGRAVGRVLAHEIGHVVLAAPNHQSHGLMRTSFLAEDLVTPARWTYTLSEAEVARLRERELALNGPAGAPVR
jgi:hypothetical protein